MPKRKLEDPVSRTFSVKCSLGRVLASIQANSELSSSLRSAIESAVDRIHTLAVKGTLIATDVVLRLADEGKVLPPVEVQSWWYKCFTSAGKLRGKRLTCKDADIESSARRLFPRDEDLVDTDLLWPFINEMSRDYITVFQNMMASTFHNQISKAFRREVTLWEYEHSQLLPKGIAFKVVDYYSRAVVQHKACSPLEENLLPESLKVQFEALQGQWMRDYADVLPCPHSSFIYNLPKKEIGKLRLFLKWMYELQVHRACCIQTLEQLIPPGSEESAEKIFRSSATAQGLMPVASFKVKCIAISPTGLQESLLKAIQHKEPKTFLDCFPGISRFLKPGKITSGNYIRTDGISASITLNVTEEAAPVPEKKRKGKKSSGIACSDKPVRPLPGQKLIAIDPGRREMLYAVTPDSVCNRGMSISTKTYRHMAGISLTAEVTRSKQERHLCRDGCSVYEKLTSLPSRRNIYAWQEFLRTLLPHLPAILECRRARVLRRTAFRAYMKRDKALDTICRELTSGSEGETLVAFGGANSCSTGFGHAPAPQARLRFRLTHHHNAKVSVVDEFRTSRYCHQCSSCLEHAHTLDKICKKRVKIHHVLSCPQCLNSKGHKQFWHRDFNAAKNILSCYLAEAYGLERPLALRRTK